LDDGGADILGYTVEMLHLDSAVGWIQIYDGTAQPDVLSFKL